MFKFLRNHQTLTAAESLYIPTSNIQGFQFLHILTNACYFLKKKKKKATLLCIKGYFLTVLTCIFPMINDVENLSVGLSAIYIIIFGEISIQVLCSLFNGVLLLSYKSSSNILVIKPLTDT